MSVSLAYLSRRKSKLPIDIKLALVNANDTHKTCKIRELVTDLDTRPFPASSQAFSSFNDGARGISWGNSDRE